MSRWKQSLGCSGCDVVTSDQASWSSRLEVLFSLTSLAKRSLPSSGVPFLQAHESTERRVSRAQSLFIRRSRIGTKMVIKIGKAGAALVKVTTKITMVTAI